jgi:hypothetical protein
MTRVEVSMISRTMVSILLLAAICGGGIRNADAAEDEHPIAVEKATKVANAWLKLVDAGKYKLTWEQAPEVFRNHVSPDQWEAKVRDTRKPLGALLSRKFKSATFQNDVPGAPPGEYVIVEYDTSFENKKDAIETVTPMRDKEGAWQVAGYFIR